MLRPKVIELSSQTSRVRLPFSFIAKNHVGSMYFGALAMGAELSVALKVVDSMQNDKVPVSFIFKDFNCQFLKRAVSDTDFYCNEVAQIEALIQKALSTNQRVDQQFNGYAMPSKSTSKEDQLMTYQLTISIKPTGKK